MSTVYVALLDEATICWRPVGNLDWMESLPSWRRGAGHWGAGFSAWRSGRLSP